MKDKTKASRPFQKDEKHENVLRVDFAKAKEERTLEQELAVEWEDTYEKLLEGLLRNGETYGDSMALMTVKADAVYSMLRAMVDAMPPVPLTVEFPHGLTNEQSRAVIELVKEAASTGSSHALQHCVETFMVAIYDLCTSRLKPGK